MHVYVQCHDVRFSPLAPVIFLSIPVALWFVQAHHISPSMDLKRVSSVSNDTLYTRDPRAICKRKHCAYLKPISHSQYR